MKTLQLLLLICSVFSHPLLTAQNAADILLEKRNENTLEKTQSPTKGEKESQPWLEKPYLNTVFEKATVEDITTAFQKWLADHPEEAKPNRRHKDDDIVKFQRKLWRWQMENEWNEVPIRNNQRIDAFLEYEKAHADLPRSEAYNPDGNWKLLGPVNHPVDIPFTEPALSTNQSLANTGLGRINCIEFSIWDTLNVWVGTSTGGVWKTWNGGKSWINISMNLPIMEISDVAIDQSNSNIIYVATGDRDGQGGYYGNGVLNARLYKTTDGGANWFQINANFGTGTFIERLWVHPHRPWEVVVVKTSGVYKSVDGGGTWTQSLTTNYVSPFAAPNDLRFAAATYADLANPERIYAAHFKRYSASNSTFQIRRSDNFGATWQLMDSVKTVINDPNFVKNVVTMSVAPSDPNCLYVYSSEYDNTFAQDRFGAIFRTLDGGRTWENRSRYPSVVNTMGWVLGDSTDIGSQWDYNLVLSVDPTNRDKVFLSGVDMWGSTDGGTSFNKTTFWVNTLGESAHADHHWGEYQPISKSYFLATDGGLYKTRNLTPGNNQQIAPCRNGRDDFYELVSNLFTPGCYTFPTKWEFVGNGISNNDFYAIGICKSNPNVVIAGAQDNGSLMYRNGRWDAVVGGWDGFVNVIHPTNPNSFITTVQFGQTWRTDDGGKTYRYQSAAMEAVDATDWLTPMEMYDANHNFVYQARQKHLWRSANGGDTWQPISNFTLGGTSNRISAFTVAPSNNNVIVVARQYFTSGSPSVRQLMVTTNGGTTWTNRWDASLFPTGGTLRDIAIHPTDPNRIWICFNVGFLATNVNQSRKVFYSDNGGNTWTNITAGLPPIPVWSIVVPANSSDNAVYVGTAIGVFYKDNTKPQFVEFQVGMPRGVMVTDLKIHDGAGKIFAGTYGRGVWSANLYDRPYDGSAQALPANRSMLLSVYPNPVNEAVTIEWDAKITEQHSLEVTDALGKTLFYQPNFLGKATFNMEQYTTGIYTIQLRTGKDVVTKKLIKGL